MKKLLAFFLIVFILNFCLAEEISSSNQPAFKSLEKNVVVTLDSLGTSIIDFNQKDGSYTIGDVRTGDTYNSVDEASHSFMKLDKDGKIQEASLTAKTNAVWNFNGKSWEVSAGSKLIYNGGKVSLFSSLNATSSEFKVTNPDKSTFKFNLTEGSSLTISPEGLLSGKYILSNDSQLIFKDSGLTLMTPSNNSIVVSEKDYLGSNNRTSFVYSGGHNWSANTIPGEGIQLRYSNNNTLSLSGGASANYTGNQTQYNVINGTFSDKYEDLEFTASKFQTSVTNLLTGTFSPGTAQFLAQNINMGDGKWFETVSLPGGNIRDVSILPRQIDDNLVRPFFNARGFNARFIFGLYSPSETQSLNNNPSGS